MNFIHLILIAVSVDTLDAEQILYKSRAVLEAPVIYDTKSGEAKSRFYLGAPKVDGESPIRVEKKVGLVDVTIIALSESEMFEVFDEHSVTIDMSFTQNLIRMSRSASSLQTQAVTKTSATNVSLHEVVEEDGVELYVVDNLLAHSEESLKENPNMVRGHRTWIRVSDFHPVRFGYLQGDGSVSPITEYVDIQPGADIPEDKFVIPESHEVVKPNSIEDYVLMKRQVFRIGAGMDLIVPTSDIKAADALARVHARGEEAVANVSALSEKIRTPTPVAATTSRKSTGMKLFLVMNGLLLLFLVVAQVLRTWFRKSPDKESWRLFFNLSGVNRMIFKMMRQAQFVVVCMAMITL